MEGGAPNNFTLLKNDKFAAPFGSTVRKGWLNFDRGKFKSFVILNLEP
jgi:hypothetical protein